MAISYGFFNSVEDDRLYNAETFNTYFEGLISKNGVFKNVNYDLVVNAGTGLTVTVGSGKALVNTHWVRLSAPETLSLDAAHNLFGRYDAVVLRWNNNTRDVTLNIVTGTPGSTPARPQPTRTGTTYEIILAYVYVGANATAITTANIYDQRTNNAVCGMVTGLVQQVNISELFAQYEARFAALAQSLKEYEDEARATFDAWYYNLTQNLTVGAYVKQYRKIVNGGATVGETVALDMEGYTYDQNDVFLVNLNGLMLQPSTDYTINSSTTPATLTIYLAGSVIPEGNRLDIMVIKSNMAQTSAGVLNSISGDKFIHAIDVLPGEAFGFIVGTMGTTNEIVVTNRNLIRLDQFDTVTLGNVTFTKDTDGSITVSCPTSTTSQELTCNIDKNAFVVGKPYTINSGSSANNVKVEVTLTYTDSSSDTFSSYGGSSVTFDVTKAVASATARIVTVADSSAINNVVIKAQLEYGSTANEFKKNSYVSFTYTGSEKPTLTDSIDNIWSNDDDVSDLQLIYIVLTTDIEGDDVLYPLD